MLDDPHWATEVMRAERPWSLGQLRKLGESIRDETPTPVGCPTYSEVLSWYNDLAVAVQSYIAELDWDALLVDRVAEVTSRAKTLDTLRDKLRRMGSHPLPSIQDIAGVRFEADMTLEEQDAVAAAIIGALEQTRECLDDIRDSPHSGYRAVHLRVNLPAGRVEIQIRTHLQGQWANMYETLGDLVGRGIRYGEVPDDPQLANVVQELQRQSTGPLAEIEGLRADVARMQRESSPELTDVISKAEERVRDLERLWIDDMRSLTARLRALRERLQ